MSLQISSSADNANAAAQASTTDNAPHHTACTSVSENNLKIPSNHVGGTVSNQVFTEPGPNGHIPEPDRHSGVNRTDLVQEGTNQIEGILYIFQIQELEGRSRSQASILVYI